MSSLLVNSRKESSMALTVVSAGKLPSLLGSIQPGQDCLVLTYIRSTTYSP